MSEKKIGQSASPDVIKEDEIKKRNKKRSFAEALKATMGKKRKKRKPASKY